MSCRHVFVKGHRSFLVAKCCFLIPKGWLCLPRAEALRCSFPWLPYALAGPAAPSSSHPAFDQSLELGCLGDMEGKEIKTRGKTWRNNKFIENIMKSVGMMCEG